MVFVQYSILMLTLKAGKGALSCEYDAADAGADDGADFDVGLAVSLLFLPILVLVRYFVVVVVRFVP